MTDRLLRLRANLLDEKIDALILAPSPSVRYFTGEDFEANDRTFLLVIPAKGKPVVVIPAFDEGIWRERSEVEAELFGWEDTDGASSALASALGTLEKSDTLAIEPLFLRAQEYEMIRGELPQSKFVSAESIIAPLRMQKSHEEIAALRQAVAVGEHALAHLIQEVRVGSTERALKGRLISLLFEHGGEGVSFGPIVLSGPKSALPHGIPDERALQVGELLLIDYGTSVSGYHCDITRTFVVGADPSPKTREVYEAVLAANARGRAAARPGITAGAVHAATQDEFKDPKYKGYLTHRTGHGLGLDIHEGPSLMEGNEEVLQTGAVMTIEPGLYEEGWGGVRIEDDLVLTEDGAESLTTFSRELQVIGR